MNTKKENKFISLNNITSIFFITIMSTSSLDNMVDGIRYLKYSAGFVAILLIIIKGLRMPHNTPSVIWCYLIIITYGLISLIWGDLKNGAKDIFFLLTFILPLITFNFLGKNTIKISFIIFSLFFVISLNSRDLGNFSIKESNAFFESGESFVFGVFAIAFFMQKRKYFFIASLFLLIITLKRIALLGVLFVTISWVLPPYIKNFITKSSILLIGNILIIAIIYLITTGFFDEISINLTGRNIAAITLGRTYHYYGVIYDILDHPVNLFFGNGAGSSYEKAVLMYSGIHNTPNLHSDTLKILYEYGLFVFIAFFYYIAKLKSVKSKLIIVYLCILFSTDNTFIYSHVMFFILLCILYFEKKIEKSYPHTKS